jgi:FkbM family methyltransferase
MKSYNLARRCDHSFLTNGFGPEAIVIDLGVNNGKFATWIADRFGCTVYGAEPDRTLCDRLAQHRFLRIVPFAIGGEDGTAVLKRATDECSTLFGGSFEPEEQMEVQVLSLESFLSVVGLAGEKRFDLIKVDIEGAELSMFENASDDLLLRVAQFTVEFHGFIWPGLIDRVRRVKSRLNSLGFRIVNFSHDNTDVLFMNRRLLDVGAIGDVYLRTYKYATGIQRKARRLRQSARR